MGKTLFWSAALLLLGACNREIIVGDDGDDEESADEATDELSGVDGDAVTDEDSGLSDQAIAKGKDLDDGESPIPDGVQIEEYASPCSGSGFPLEYAVKSCGGGGGITVRLMGSGSCFWSEVTTNAPIPTVISAWTVYLGAPWGYSSRTGTFVSSDRWHFGGVVPKARGQNATGTCTAEI